jgi:hypothetical protein
MGAYEDFDKLTEYPITDLLKRPRREELVPDLCFKTGVTTFVGPSGKAKTTMTFSMALAIDAGAQWGGQSLDGRPMKWIAGEGRDDLRPIFEALLKVYPHWKEKLRGSFFDEPIDLSDHREADKLIRRINKGNEPPFLVTDALNDMMGDADEDKSKDMLKIYRNVWRVVKETNASFWLPCHAGWSNERERGSSLIRYKSDITLLVDNYDPKGGKIVLKHLKRRGGAMLKNIVYEIKLVRVAGYPQLVPIVTGVRLDAGKIAAGGVAPEYTNAAKVVEIMVRCFPNGARTEELNKQFQEETGLKRQTFYKAFNLALAKQWIVGNGPYNLNPNKCWMEVVQEPLQSTVPYKGGQSEWTSPMDNKWTSGQTESCKTDDTTGSAENLNENNKTEGSVDPSKMTDFEKEMWEDLKGKRPEGRGDSTKH